jgi:hypothetical protein
VDLPQNKGIVVNKNETLLKIPTGQMKAFQKNIEAQINAMGAPQSSVAAASNKATPPAPKPAPTKNAKVAPMPIGTPGGVKSAWN